MISLFEVLEHFIQPMTEITRLLDYTQNLLFTTELIPTDGNISEDWWYLSKEHGQHIAFYSKKTLEYIAAKFNLRFLTNGKNFHLLTSKKIPETYFRISTSNRVSALFDSLYKRKSLLEIDYIDAVENGEQCNVNLEKDL